MLFLLGLTGLIQLVLLPGLLWIRAVRIPPRNAYEALLYPFAASLVWNYLIASTLVAFSAHNRRSWLLIVLVEAVALSLLYLRRTGGTADMEAGPGRAPRIAAAFALVTVFAFIPLLWDNWGSVYTSNDDVASWDRWAGDWFANRLPVGTKLYPQLLPVNWSISYALLGTNDIKMFGKAIMPLFPLGIAVTYLALERRRRDSAYWIGAALVAFFLFVYLGAPFLLTGYADVASAFFAFLAFAVLWEREDARAPEFPSALAILFASGAALAKQGGVLVLIAICLWAAFQRIRSRAAWRDARPALFTAIFAALCVAAWYGWQIYSTYRGAEASNLKFLTVDIHEGRGFWQRIVYGCHLLINRGGTFGLLFWWASAGLFLSRTRALVAFVVFPLFFLWAALFSYETRTAAILFPFAALAAGLVWGEAARRLSAWLVPRVPLFERHRLLAIVILLVSCARALHFFGLGTQALKEVYFWPFLAVAALCAFRYAIRPLSEAPALRINIPVLLLSTLFLAAAAGTVRYPAPQLLKQQLRARRAIGKPEVNIHLYELFEGGKLNQPVIGNYWYFQSLPELGPLNRLLTCGANCTLQNVLRDVELTTEAQFLLVEDLFLPAATVRNLGFCRGLEPVFSEGTVRLFHIDRERFQAKAEACKADPELSRPAIIKLYPPSTTAGVGFNVQPDGMSALGVQCKNASQTSVIYWNGTALASAFGGADAVSGLVSPRLYAKSGRYAIDVFDRETGMRSTPVYFEVK